MPSPSSLGAAPARASAWIRLGSSTFLVEILWVVCRSRAAGEALARVCCDGLFIGSKTLFPRLRPCSIVGFAEAQVQRRIALVVGQGAYTSPTELANPRLDARRMAALLTRHGFDVIACDGSNPGCFDLTRVDLLAAQDLA